MKAIKTIIITLSVLVHSFTIGASHLTKGFVAIEKRKFVHIYNFNVVKATVYYPQARQCDSTFWETADMSVIDTTNAIRHRWIAVSQDLLKMNGGSYRYGDKVMVKGIGNLSGVYTIRDCMNKRFKNKIDILVGKQNKSLHYKSWKEVKITKI
jgi:3D (Asp-Asp-Asp) domain-containing protein